MAARRPLVRVSGQTRQLPAGDTVVGTKLIRGANWSGGGGVVIAPAEDVAIACSVAGVIKAMTILGAGGPGSCVIDVWKGAYASFPLAAAASIVGSSKPTVSSAHKAQDTALTGWTTVVAAGDVLVFHLESASTFTNVHIELEIEA